MATAATARADAAGVPEPVPEEVAAERAREVAERYGDDADAYVETRIEASRTSGEDRDVLMWERVSQMLSAEATPAGD